MPDFDPELIPHRRRNPLLGQSVLVSPHRTARPWLGQQESTARPELPRHDPSCYLCPGNPRAAGSTNPAYTGTYVFTNDFSALLPDGPELPSSEDPLFVSSSVSGTCRVICYSPRHDLTLADLELPAIASVIETWADESAVLGQLYPSVQIFENKGSVMGCSNPHPHGQIWASSSLPHDLECEDVNQRTYRRRHQRSMLLDVVTREIDAKVRVVCENQDYLVVVPYWAVWPFETLLLPKFPVAHLEALSGAQRGSLAQLLKTLLTTYDRLFSTSFPYSFGWHGAPYLSGDVEHFQLHAHFFPPLLRSASVRKFMVGYELLAEPQRDLTPEQAAARLRALVDD